jgi:hypothetical protein
VVHRDRLLLPEEALYQEFAALTSNVSAAQHPLIPANAGSLLRRHGLEANTSSASTALQTVASS